MCPNCSQSLWKDDQGKPYIDPDLGVHGKLQCRNLKDNFEYMKQIRYIICSPSTRVLQTAYFTFKGCMRANEKKVPKILVWSALRMCGSSDGPAKEIPAADRGASIKVLKEKLKDKPFWFASELVGEGWESNGKENWSRIPRADQVRQDLHKLAEIAIGGGDWKGLAFKPHTGSDNFHVAIVSHTAFLNLVTRDTSE